MHIAHFTNTYLPTISGVVRSVSSFRRGLSDLGHNVFVFTQGEADYVDEDPFIFRYLSLNLGLPNEFPATIPLSPFMDRVIPILKLDVIHAHHPVLLGQIAANKAEELDLPLVFTFHTRYREYSHYLPLPQEVVQEFVKDAIDFWIKEYIQQCDHIVAPSESMRTIINEVYQHEGNITVVPTGIDLQPYTDAEGGPVRAEQNWGDDFVIISVGRLAPEKNWRMLLEACQKVMTEHPRARLVLIGDGPDKKKLEKRAKELGIADRVQFTGKLPFEDIPAFLKAADLFAFASTTETQGLVTLEAMAAGLPVVAADAIGAKDVIENEKDGFLVDATAEAMTAQIVRLIDDEQTLTRFSEAAFKKAESLNYLNQAKQMLDVYEAALESKQAKVAQK